MDTEPFPRMLRRSLVTLVIGAALVALCYFFVDRPVAFFVSDRQIDHNWVLKWLTYPPPIVQSWVPLVLAGLMVRRAVGPFRPWERVLLAAGVAMVLADQFRESLSFLFGRYWPDTWIQNNPSLIQDGAYGFHPFHSGSAYHSFPSGHTARTVAAVAPFWIAYRSWRWACVLATAAVAVALVGMNYHFVGDVLAGGLVGGIVGAYTALLLGVSKQGCANDVPLVPPG